MPPRKASDSAGAEPRRSGRIASQPALPAAEVKPMAPKATKKRSAEAVDETKEGEASAAKKAKADDQPETTETKETAETTEPTEEAKPETPSLTQLEIGDNLPTLTLKNEKAEDIQISELAAERGVILFLVPKADTPGCTKQACAFRDSYPDFTSSNFNVYCLSADSPTAQSKWQTKKELPYPLISDPKRTLITALGAGKDGKTQRSHFIFEKGGKLVEKKLPVSPADSPKLALEYAKSHVQ